MHTPLFPIVEDAQASLVNGTLYVVATPIGNVADISLRALAVLARADLICAEDTRVTGQLLTRYGIQSKLVSSRASVTRRDSPNVTAMSAAHSATRCGASYSTTA